MDSVELERKTLKERVDAGDAVAVIELIQHYLDYESPEDALPIILKLLENSAARNSPLAAFELWRLYASFPYDSLDLIKDLVPANAELAQKWQKNASDWGHPKAMLSLAKETMKKGDYEAAMALVERTKAIDSALFENQSDQMMDWETEASELKAQIEEEKEKAIQRAKILENIDQAVPEELYNLAMGILRTSGKAEGSEARKQAIQYLEVASQKGLILAKKLLKELK